MLSLSLTISIVSLFLLVLLLKDNKYFLNLLYKLQTFWFYDYINVILVIGIVPVFNIFMFSLILIYSIFRFKKD